MLSIPCAGDYSLKMETTGFHLHQTWCRGETNAEPYYKMCYNKCAYKYAHGNKGALGGLYNGTYGDGTQESLGLDERGRG